MYVREVLLLLPVAIQHSTLRGRIVLLSGLPRGMRRASRRDQMSTDPARMRSARRSAADHRRGCDRLACRASRRASEQEQRKQACGSMDACRETFRLLGKAAPNVIFNWSSRIFRIASGDHRTIRRGHARRPIPLGHRRTGPGTTCRIRSSAVRHARWPLPHDAHQVPAAQAEPLNSPRPVPSKQRRRRRVATR